MKTHACLMLGAFLSVVQTSPAQTTFAENTTTVRNTVGGPVSGVMGFSSTSYSGPPIVGAPFSAEEVIEHVQTLADGTRITQPAKTRRLFRDSQGRLRTERVMGAAQNGGEVIPPIVEITDSVAGIRYILDTQHHVAHRTALKPLKTPRMPAEQGGVGSGVVSGGSIAAGVNRDPVPRPVVITPSTGAAPQPDMTSESLGRQSIEGVQVEGRRTTSTLPIGSIGNDRPITTVHEFWTSPELKQMVLIKNSDPRNGENTTRLTNISRAEPDASLFQPPPDYSVVDETGTFSIRWGNQ